MAIFIARMSRGRSIRQIIVMLSFVLPLQTNSWPTTIGGAFIHFEVSNRA